MCFRRQRANLACIKPWIQSSALQLQGHLQNRESRTRQGHMSPHQNEHNYKNETKYSNKNKRRHNSKKASISDQIFL